MPSYLWESRWGFIKKSYVGVAVAKLSAFLALVRVELLRAI